MVRSVLCKSTCGVVDMRLLRTGGAIPGKLYRPMDALFRWIVAGSLLTGVFRQINGEGC